MSVKKQKCTFKIINEELNEVYDYLAQQNVGEKEIKQAFSLLLNKRKCCKKIPYFFLLIASVLFILYLLSSFDYFSWHLTAVGRIIMIKLLPYFDWTYLKNERCLLPKIWNNAQDYDRHFNCALCENIQEVDVYETIDEDVFVQRYVDVDAPLIITKGIEKWAGKNQLLNYLISEENFYDSLPCKLSTNIYNGVTYSGKLLERTKLFHNFFLHFQNCEKDAVRIFRKYTYRPDFLPDVYSPVLHNWIIWSKDYNTTIYKKIELVESLALFGQISGTNHVRLLPRKNCETECPVIEFVLKEGESLVFTSLFDLEYRPAEHGENLAAILEMRG